MESGTINRLILKPLLLVLAATWTVPLTAASKPRGGAAKKQMERVRIHASELFQSPGFRSRKNREVSIYRLGKADASHRFLIQGGLHGDEVLAHGFVRWLLRRLESGKGALAKLASDGAAFDIIPAVNPDGLASMTRTNAKGVNLNRNFSTLWGITREFPGNSAFSEPETRIIRRLLTSHRYTAAVDVHGYANWIVVPSTPGKIGKTARGIKTNARKKQDYRRWIKGIGEATKSLGGYEIHTAGGLGDGGAFEDWAFWEADTLAFCLEILRPEQWKSLSGRQGQQAVFVIYEKYLSSVFSKAIKIRGEEIASN